MTTKQLNADIKKLHRTISANLATMTNEQFFDWRLNVAKPEFTRLYYADTDMIYMNSLSVRIMFSLNLSHRFVALHSFGANIAICY